MADHDPHTTPSPETTAGHPTPGGYHGQHGGVPEIPEGAYDPWADHTNEPPPRDPHGASASPRALALTLVAMTFGVLFVIVTLVVYFDSYTAQLKSARQEGYESFAREYRALRSDAEANLNVAEPTWADSAAGRVRIPVAQAMQRVVEEYREIGGGLDPLRAAPEPAGVGGASPENEGGL